MEGEGGGNTGPPFEFDEGLRLRGRVWVVLRGYRELRAEEGEGLKGMT